MPRLIRIAMVCPKADCDWREFGNPRAVCPEHGRSERQANRPYCGQPTPAAPKK